SLVIEVRPVTAWGNFLPVSHIRFDLIDRQLHTHNGRSPDMISEKYNARIFWIYRHVIG
ncbi:MAG: hypothetical protein ACI9JR_002855, partial [Gammaproteobacteria bacterium]